jgi:hypothetical protein
MVVNEIWMNLNYGTIGIFSTVDGIGLGLGENWYFIGFYKGKQ